MDGGIRGPTLDEVALDTTLPGLFEHFPDALILADGEARLRSGGGLIPMQYSIAPTSPAGPGLSSGYIVSCGIRGFDQSRRAILVRVVDLARNA